MNSDVQHQAAARSGIDFSPSPELLCSLVDHHDVAALIVDIKTFELRWSSQASVRLDNRLRAGVSLRDVPELYSVLHESLSTGVESSEDLSLVSQTKMLARCTLRPPLLVAETTAEMAGVVDDAVRGAVNTGVGDVSVSLKSVSRYGDLLLLQIEYEQALDSYYRQYVAEREELFNTSRALTVNEMATTLAHELNQPIGTVVNLLHGCLDRLKSHNELRAERTDDQVDTDVIDALDFAIRQSRFASQIISRIREFTEARQPNIEQHDIREIIQESVQLLDWVLASEGIDLSLQTGPMALMVGCDRMLLQQVIMNLCRNAIEAMREMPEGERRLRVHAYTSDDGMHLDIIDTGPGMNEAAAQDMFKPFVTSKRHGMGVGLNICRSFIELHQGRLWVTHNHEQGCTIHIRLPKSASSVDAAVSAGGQS